MERSEPTLVPEWLRGTGSVSGGGNSAHQFVLSSSQSDVHSTRNRCSKSLSNKDTPCSALLDRNSSSSSHRSSRSNGSSKHPYSSFSRSHRDKNRDKDKERSVNGDPWDNDVSDSFGDILISRVEKNTLRRSRSLVCRKPGEVLTQRAVDSKNGGSSNHSSSNGLLSGGNIVRNTKKTAFEKEYPSLGTGEKQGGDDIGRVSSPGSSTAVQCLPFGNPGLIGGEGWTSALAEVPTIIGNNSMPTSAQQSVFATPSGASSPTSNLNMAETLSQAPPRARTTPQMPDKSQRLEELAIKQSRQLIPMTPLMPKGLWLVIWIEIVRKLNFSPRGMGLHAYWLSANWDLGFDFTDGNCYLVEDGYPIWLMGAVKIDTVLSSDKSKPKAAGKTNEMNVAAKSVQLSQPHTSQLANQSLRGDAPRSSHTGKFLVLKPVRENGISSMGKDVSNSPSNGSRVANSQVAAAPMPPPTPLKSPNSSKLSTVERKISALSLNSGSTVEKKSSLSQAKSRSDFFNLMRKKTSTDTSTVLPDPGVAVSAPTVEESGELVKGASGPVSSCVNENCSELTSNGAIHEGEENFCLNGVVYPDEEEVAFLRSLGWEENAGEDDGLTEEEINAFYERCMKLRPSLKLCRGVQPKLSMLSESHMSGSGRASSEA
ncbi:hypothetical protein Acr_00g0076620 [Actinidia rufa]|uniref:Uncharacterized protein n=1 Tax=Actinidia rufa TaxID=165716 RepID=A0A7J0DUC4_9ERIC|nr:hypothetical protein Acr_00g0076620 [Actinidia rufa]